MSMVSEADLLAKALERRAILLGVSDGPASLKTAGRLGRLIRAIFGTEAPGPLADPRLESLRRLAIVFAHHVTSGLGGEVRAGLSAGLSMEEISVLAKRLGYPNPV